MKKLLLFVTIFLIPTIGLADFSDVPPTNPYYTAISALEDSGIIEGYDDGTFKPDQLVTRAEAVKIVFLPLYENFPEVSEKPFPDIDTGLWYTPYISTAKSDGVVSGDGDTGNFDPGRNVNKVEFLKILLLAYDIDLTDFQSSEIELFNDLRTSEGIWYYPYVYYASETNLVNPDGNNNINASAQLTRAQVADITYRLLKNKAGGDTQLYLSMSEAKMIQTLQYLQLDDLAKAKYTSDKAIHYSGKALELSPEESIVLAANKISMSFKELVISYESGLNEDYVLAEAHATESWSLADEAQGIDSSVDALATNIKEIAHAMAESARESM